MSSMNSDIIFYKKLLLTWKKFFFGTEKFVMIHVENPKLYVSPSVIANRKIQTQNFLFPYGVVVI
jgi:hypothetical protein